jgi:hypothetical protein
MYVHFWDLNDDASSRYAQAGHFAPVAVDGLHVGEDVTVGADVGVQFAGAYDGPGMSPVTLLQKRGLYLDVNTAQVIGPLATMVRASHTMLPLFDGQLVRDNRLAGSIQLTLPGSTLRAEGFVAQEQVLRDMPGSQTLVLAGGAADGAWSAGHGLVVFGRVEVARSLVAGLASEPVRAMTEVRATLGINAHYDLRWPKRR